MLEIEIMRFEAKDIITASVPMPTPDTELRCTCNIGHSQCERLPTGVEHTKNPSCGCMLPDSAKHNFD